MKYAWITQHGDSFPIAVMCDVLEVSTSGYYASVDRAPSPRAQREKVQLVGRHLPVTWKQTAGALVIEPHPSRRRLAFPARLFSATA